MSAQRFLTALAIVGAVGGAAALAWFALAGGTSQSVEILPPPGGNRPTKAKPGDPPRPPSPVDPSDPPGPSEPAVPADPDPPADAERIPAPPPLSATVEPGAGLVFASKEHGDALAKVDWNRAGVAARKTIEAAQVVARDVPRDVSSAERLHDFHEAQGDLYRTIEPCLLDVASRHPLLGPDVVFTHPAVYGNLVAAVLRANHRPLREDQTEAIRAVVEKARLVRAEEPFREAPEEGVLGRRIALVEARLALRDAVEAILDEPQRRVLWPGGVRDRTGLDMLGPAAVLAGRVERVELAEASQIPEFVGAKLVGLSSLPHERVKEMFRAVADWMEGRGAAPFGSSRGELSRRGFLPFAEALAAARATKDLHDHVLRTLGLVRAQTPALAMEDMALQVTAAAR